MFCPKCKAEYVVGINECSSCKIPLVLELEDPGVDIPEYNELETVYSSGDSATIPVAKSLLQAANIDYYTFGEDLQEIVGVGRLGVGYNNCVGNAQIKVKKADAEIAKELLKDLEVMLNT